MCNKKCKAVMKCLFRISCVMLSFGAIMWNIHLFCLDEDSVEIEVKEMHFKEDKFHPSLTLCFHREIIHQRNVFIGNPRANDQLQDKPDRRIFHINDYIGDIVVKHKNEKRAVFTKTGLNIKPYDEVKYTGRSRKVMLRSLKSTDCLDINIPLKQKGTIHSITVAVKDDVFRSKDPSTRIKNWIEIGLAVQNDVFILPNLFLMPNENLNGPELDSDQKQDCSGITFHVKEIEILRRRNKPSNPCINSIKNSALPILNYAVNRLQCLPNGWEIAHVLPDCRDKTLNEKAKQTLNQVQAALHYFYYKPITKFCQSIRHVQIQHDSTDSVRTCTDDTDTINVTAIYDNYSLTETRLIRSYTVTNLLFNIGYIVGLFLGLSLIQLPVIVTKLICTICRRLRVLRRSKEPETLLNGHIPRQATDLLDRHIVEINSKLTLANDEIQNLKKDSSLFKNHIMQLRALVLLQQREYDTMV